MKPNNAKPKIGTPELVSAGATAGLSFLPEGPRIKAESQRLARLGVKVQIVVIHQGTNLGSNAVDGTGPVPWEGPILGIADDAIVLRLAALQAVGEGAEHRAVRQLAGQAADVERVLGELTAPLKALVASLADRPVRGRTAAQILDSADARAVFEADLTRVIQRHESAPVAPIPGGETAVVEELRRMVRAALKRAGVA